MVPYTAGLDTGSFVECAPIVALMATTMYCFYQNLPTDIVKSSNEFIGCRTYLLGNIEDLNPQTLTKYGGQFRNWFGQDAIPLVLLTEMSPDVTADNSHLYTRCLPTRISYSDHKYELSTIGLSAINCRNMIM